MADNNSPKGIFHGTDEIVSKFFGLRPKETLKQKSACRRIASTGDRRRDFVGLISELYGRIENNRPNHLPLPSRENWRSESQTTLNPENKSPEVVLERAIAILGKREISHGWFNQVPVASGLVNSTADKRAAIDLVYHRNDRAEFIELKWKSDTPAYAAFEILLYGIVYLFSYVNREKFKYAGKPLMKVGEVSLRVLAPKFYYDSYVDSDMTWLSEGLDHGIRTLAAKETGGAVSMNFGYLAFPAGFSKLPFETGEDVRAIKNLPVGAEVCQQLISALDGVRPIWSNSK